MQKKWNKLEKILSTARHEDQLSVEGDEFFTRIKIRRQARVKHDSRRKIACE